jgi:hypothetical protein
MSEEREAQPFKAREQIAPTPLQLRGPNVISTFDTPLHPDAVRAQDASIRKYLQDHKPRPGGL